MSVFVLSGTAAAYDCPYPDYSSESCVVDSVAVCSAPPTEFKCDVSGSDQSAEVYMVTYFGSGSAKVSAWGEMSGEKFCCTSGPNWDGYLVSIKGSGHGDTLSFFWANTEEYVEHEAISPYGVDIIRGTIDGGAGNDVITGSDEDVCDYEDVLNGEGNSDTIDGRQGDDTIDGGIGADTLLGGSGVDTMYGDDQSDTMIGGLGSDFMNGEEGNDYMSGRDGDDTMDGGPGADAICGEDGEDTLDDGDSTDEGYPADKLWGAESGDSVYCGHTSTLADTESTVLSVGTCGEQTSRPAACP